MNNQLKLKRKLKQNLLINCGSISKSLAGISKIEQRKIRVNQTIL